MLNSSEFHLLVGLMIRASSAEAVDIIAGSPRWDIASKELRDIDITVTCKMGDHKILGIRGFEAKQHKRPLTVEQVEQLCIKFKDIPELTEKYIVSASGYTKGANKKARSHDVELLEFVSWNGEFVIPEYRAFDKDLNFFIYNFCWSSSPIITLIPEIYIENYLTLFSKETELFDAEGDLHTEFPNVRIFIDSLIPHAKQAFQKSWNNTVGEIGPQKVKFTINIENEIYFKYHTKFIRIPIMLFSADVDIQKTQQKTEFKVLRKFNSSEPLIGCLIAEGHLGNLFAISLDPNIGRLGFAIISADSRALKKIKNMEL